MAETKWIDIPEKKLKEAGYEQLSLLEPFSMEELEMAMESLNRILGRCKDNDIQLDERWPQTLKDFLTKAKERIITTQIGEQGDYEHANQVHPSEITQGPHDGASTKTQVDQPLNNNGDSNVGS